MLVSPEWIQQVSWGDSSVAVSLDRQDIKSAPAYTVGMSIDRDAESGIYHHYGRKAFWNTPRERDAA